MSGKTYLRLGVNIDHVATVRNARGIAHPDPVRAAILATEAGADGITVHLREDRRHIMDSDVRQLLSKIEIPLNLEMAATDEMVKFALRYKPHAVCIVPEKREELTTEGGLDATAGCKYLGSIVRELVEAGIRVSLFIDAEKEQIDAAVFLGANVVELHTGSFCEMQDATVRKTELERIQNAANHAVLSGLECHAGHGLSYDTVGSIAAIPEIVELNIGHFLIGEGMMIGLDKAIINMRTLMNQARMQTNASQKTL